MDYLVLGTFEVHDRGRRVSIGGPKQRLALASLLVRANDAVTVDQLVDDLWGDDPPVRARKTLQVYMANLRKAVGTASDRIGSEPAGYRLSVERDELDAFRFEDGCRRAERLRPHDEVAASDCLAQALALWRGEPFADLYHGEPLLPFAVRLRELRLLAMEDRFAIELSGGRSAEVVGELRRWAVQHPLREGLWALLIEALYRQGRQADALRTYQQLRVTLREETGLNPSAAVQALERRILDQDPRLAQALPVGDSPTGSHERRQVTLVSAGLASYPSLAETLDPEELAARVSAVQGRAAHVVARFGGRLLRRTDSGVLAVFGHPRASGEDASRAVKAAGAVVAGSPEACAGIHTGEVVVEEVTGDVAGEPPSVASRLEDAAAPGEILVSADAAAVAGGELGLVHRPHVSARRRGRDLPVYAVVGPAPAPRREGRPDPQIGRDAELADLLRAVLAGLEGRPVLVLVTGDPGMGKSRLVAELERRVAADLSVPWTTTTWRCQFHLRDQALHPVAADLAEIRTRAPEGLAVELERRGVPPPDAHRQAGALSRLGEGSSGGVGAQHAVIEWLDVRGGGRPHLIVVEDVHHADPATIELIAALSAQSGPGAIVATSRHGEVDLPSGIIRHRIHLDPLRLDAARTIVRQTAHPVRLRLSLVEEICRRGAGNALHLQQLTLATVESRSAGSSRVPPTLRDSLMGRLDRLGNPKRTAQRCAAIGTSFDLEMATVAGGGDPALVGHDLAVLVAAGVLVAEPGDRPRYDFAHALLRDVSYDSLSRRDRAELHDRLARHLTGVGATRPEVLGFHLQGAGRDREAAVTWLDAADRCVAASQFPEAIVATRRGLQAIEGLGPGMDRDDLELRCRMVLSGALLLAHSGSDELRGVAWRAHELAERTSRVPELLGIYPILVACLQALGDYDGASRVGLEGLTRAKAFGAGPDTLLLAQFHGATLIWQGRVPEGRDLLGPVSLEWEQLGISPSSEPRLVTVTCAHKAMMGLSQWVGNDRKGASHRFATARKLAEDAGLPVALCLVRATEAITLQMQGDAAAVYTVIDSAHELALQLANDWWFIWCQLLKGWAVGELADTAAGVAMMEEGVAHAGSIRQLVPYFNGLIASQLLRAGRLDDATSRIRSALAMAHETGEGFFVPELRRMQAVLQAATGTDAALVGRSLDSAEQLARHQGQPALVDRIAATREELRSKSGPVAAAMPARPPTQPDETTEVAGLELEGRSRP